MISSDKKKWFDSKGKEFFTAIGLHKNQQVLDFGCGYGTYAIPAAMTSEENGRVYAADKDADRLQQVLTEAQQHRLTNITTLHIKKETIPLPDTSLDIAFLFDVLHLLDNRKKILTELYRVLKSTGTLALYPKHHQQEMHMTLDEITNEVESIGFQFKTRVCKTLMHDDQLEQGAVLIFQKP